MFLATQDGPVLDVCTTISSSVVVNVRRNIIFITKGTGCPLVWSLSSAVQWLKSQEVKELDNWLFFPTEHVCCSYHNQGQRSNGNLHGIRQLRRAWREDPPVGHFWPDSVSSLHPSFLFTTFTSFAKIKHTSKPRYFYTSSIKQFQDLNLMVASDLIHSSPL